MPSDPPPGLTIPLADSASRRLADLGRIAGVPAIAALSGDGLLGERARINGFRIPGLVSAGGGCRLLASGDGSWIALNLARADDRTLLPALFADGALDAQGDAAIAKAAARADALELVARGREMGLAMAALDEMRSGPAMGCLAEYAPPASQQPCAPLVVDLSALWAGPLAGHLLWLAGAQVLKVESSRRPDAMRTGDPAHFALLNQGKASIALNFADGDDRRALMMLLERADVVIEASRPRALAQLGIDASASLRTRPGQVWLTITGHGASAPCADWVGFGDDCGVAGGLASMLARLTGKPGFVGDAIADPLTGITAALAACEALQARRTCRIGVSMSGVVADMVAQSCACDRAGFEADLKSWAAAQGAPFPAAPMRSATAPVQALGAANDQWLTGTPPC